jgi:hypothetical protein
MLEKSLFLKDASLARLQMLQLVIKQVYKFNDGIEVPPIIWDSILVLNTSKMPLCEDSLWVVTT